MNSTDKPDSLDSVAFNSTWPLIKIREVANYVNEKMRVRDISIYEYVSTENMLVNKGGIVKATILPSKGNITKYCPGDVLLSNIRPYFKKIWLAKNEGGCSTDVLVIRAKQEMDSTFLYYCLSQDKFFDYVVAVSRGTKMPRGDKNAILEFFIPKPHLKEQKIVAKVLSVLDSKIELNQQMNKNLESIAQAL